MSSSTGASSWRCSAFWVALGFVLSGMLTGGLMQADVTVYERAFSLDHEVVSYWLSLFAVLTALGGGVAGFLSDRLGAGRVYRVCIVLSGFGLAGFAWNFLPGTLAGFLAAGIGIGGLVVGNILVADDKNAPPNRALNILHASHGVARLLGVVLSIFVVGVLWQASYLILGIAFVFLAVVYRPAPSVASARPETSDDPAAASLDLAWVCSAFLLYMTAEMVLVTWLAAYFEQDLQWSLALSKTAYVVFLSGLISGRFLCAKFWPRELTGASCRNIAILHAAAVSVFMMAGQPAVLCVALFAAGFCQGPGWPSLFSFSIRRSKGREGKVTGIVYIVCCIGIILSTAGSGVMAQHSGLKSVFYAVGIAHLLFSFIFYRLIQSSPAPEDVRETAHAASGI